MVIVNLTCFLTNMDCSQSQSNSSTVLKLTDDLVLYIFVNSDLKLRPGRIAAQVSHITHILIDTITKDIYETVPIPHHCIRYLQWCKNPTTVILRATQSELIELLKLPDTLSFSDHIDTNIELTTVGMFPIKASLYDFSKYKLL